MYLNCHSYYSLRYGTFSEVALLELAVANNVDTLALTDINNTSACMNFIQQAKKHHIQPVVGVDFRNGNAQQFVALAKSNIGFENINRYLSSFLESKTPIPDTPSYLEDVCIIYPFEKVLELHLTSFAEHEFIGVSIAEINKLRFSYLKKFEDKLVIQQPVTLRNKRDFNAHRLLRAIANNLLLSKLPTTEACLATDRMHTTADLEESFKEFPVLIANTNTLLQQCKVHFGYDVARKNQNLDVYGASFEQDCRILVQLCTDKMAKRYPNPTEKEHARLQKELKVIIELKFVSFFLINYDIVSYAKKK